MKKITHFPAQCLGCMACVGLAPDLFDVDETTGLAHLIGGQPDGENFSKIVPDEDASEILATACCGNAIEITDQSS